MNLTIEQLLETVASALKSQTDAQSRQRGADAAKSLHALLSAEPGTPLVPQAPVKPAAELVSKLAETRSDMFLDAIIAKLQSIAPKEPPTRQAGFDVPFVTFGDGGRDG